MASPGRDQEGNPIRPVAPGRQGEVNTQALDGLTKAITRLQETFTAQQGTPQQQIIAGQNALSTGGQTPSGVLLPSQAREALQEQSERQPPGGISPNASVPPEYYDQAAIGPKMAIKGAIKARKEGKSMLEGAFNQEKPRRSEADPILESRLDPNSMAPNAKVNRGPEMDQEELQAREPDNPESEVYRRRGNSKRYNESSSIAPGISRGLGEEIGEDQLKIPQYGDWQIDTKLRMARDVAYRYAERDSESEGGPSTLGKAAGKISSIANYGYAHAAQYQLTKLYAQKALGYGEGLQGAGAALGYSPQGMGGSSILGFRNPLSMLPFGSSAARQGAGMNFDAFKLARLGNGLSDAQAKEAFESAASMGFSNQESGFLGMTTGGDLNNVVNGFMAPRMREGASAGALSPFLEMLKPGNVSIKELSDSIKGLGEAAKATHQTVDQTSASIQQYTTAAIEHGATNIQGINAAKGFEITTGLPSTVLSNAMNSPMYQAGAMAQTGVLPQNIGTLPSGVATEVLLKRATELKRGIKLPGVHNAKGEEIVSGAEETDSWIAQQLGLTNEQLKSLQKRGPKIESLAAARAATEPGSVRNKLWGNEEGAAQTRVLKKKYQEEYDRTDSRKAKEQLAKEWNEGEKGRFGHHAAGVQSIGREAEHILEEGGNVGGHHIAGKKEIYNDLWKAAGGSKESKKELKEFWDASNKDSSKVANKIIAKHGQPGINEGVSASVNGVTIGLTPEARKVLKITGVKESQRSANAGGASTTSAAAQPLEPSTTVPTYGNEEG